MELFFTDNSYEVSGVPRPGVPFLLDKDMADVSEVNDWLAHVALVAGRTRSKNTWENYGRVIYSFFSWLEACGIKWDKITEIELASYRDSMLEGDNPCKPSTVNMRLTVVSAFYTWAKKKGLIEKMPFEMVSVRVNRGDTFLKHVDNSGGMMMANELKLRTLKKDRPYLTEEQIKIVIRNLPSFRDQLIVCAMLETGMRREEVLDLTKNMIPHPSAYGTKTMVGMNIVGKGKRERTVVFSVALIRMINKYILNDRLLAARKYKKKHGVLPDKLWLGKDGAPIVLRTINNIMGELSKRVSFKVHPHMFRHTYGYRYYAKTRDIVGLAKRMGHSHITTTQIYSHIDPEEMIGFDEDVLSDLNKIVVSELPQEENKTVEDK